MKRYLTLYIICVLLTVVTAGGATMQQTRFHCAGDTTLVNELLWQGAQSGLTDAGLLVVFYAHRLQGTPYVAHTLECDSGEMLTVNVHQLDCTTFVETLYALVRTTLDGRYSWRDYAAHLESLRYRGGIMGDYATRLHYISDWIVDNRMRGNLEEVTPDLPHCSYQVKTINFMTEHRGAYSALVADSAMTARIAEVERGYRNHRMPCLKKSWLTRSEVKDVLRPGDFVGLVTTIAGLDVSHLGIVHKDAAGEVYLMDASSIAGRVVLESQPLAAMLKSRKSCPGIRVFRMK